MTFAENAMKKIVAINASPRLNGNTAALVDKAAEGAQAQGAQVETFALYRLEKFTGCISCFGCKLVPHEGRCICRDGLSPVLEAIRSADGLILGTPNYLGDASAGFRALYERLIFQSLTYQTERPSYSARKIPVLFIMTSNAARVYYPSLGYQRMIENYQQSLGSFVGNTKVMIAGNTLQVKNYDRFHWTMFDAAAKQAYHDEVFPGEEQEALRLGAEMAAKPW